MIRSYDEACEHMRKARNVSAGRLLTGAEWRMFKDGDEYPVYVSKTMVGRFLPDNTFLFTIDGADARPIAHKLSITMGRNLPMIWKRIGTRRYAVVGAGHPLDTRVEVYDGLQFDLNTRTPMNPRVIGRPEVDPERRKEWLAASKAWKQHVRLLGRLGVLDTYIDKHKAVGVRYEDIPTWGQSKELDILYTDVKTGMCSVEVADMLVRSLTRSFHRPSTAKVVGFAYGLLSTHSTELRDRFGVFKGEVRDNKFRI